MDQIVNLQAQHELVLFLNYDGTSTPMVDRPELATLSEDMRALLTRLAARCTLVIVSGRDRQDVQHMVRLETLIYNRQSRVRHCRPRRAAPATRRGDEQPARPRDSAAQQLRQRLGHIEGVLVERKRFAIAVHSRLVADKDVGRIAETVDQLHQQHPGLRQMRGKKVVELQPEVAWDKGRAVLLWRRQTLGLDRPQAVTIYMGWAMTSPAKTPSAPSRSTAAAAALYRQLSGAGGRRRRAARRP